MSEDRLRYIEVIAEEPSTADAGESSAEAQRAAFQTARRSAEVLAEEAGLRLTSVQQIVQISEDQETGGSRRVRYRVRFGTETTKSAGGRAGFQVAE